MLHQISNNVFINIYITIKIRSKNLDKLAYLEVLVGNSVISISTKTIIQSLYTYFDDGKFLLNNSRHTENEFLLRASLNKNTIVFNILRLL